MFQAIIGWKRSFWSNFKMIIKNAPKAPVSFNNGLKHSKTSLDNGFYQ